MDLTPSWRPTRGRQEGESRGAGKALCAALNVGRLYAKVRGGPWKLEEAPKPTVPGASENTQPCRHPGFVLRPPEPGQRVCAVPRPVVIPCSSPGRRMWSAESPWREHCQFSPARLSHLPSVAPWGRLGTPGEEAEPCRAAILSDSVLLCPHGLTVPGWTWGHMQARPLCWAFQKRGCSVRAEPGSRVTPSQPCPRTPAEHGAIAP